MSFEAPLLLLGLLVVPLAGLGYWLLQRRPPRYAVRYTNLEVLAGVAGGRRAWRRHVPAALLLASLAALCVAFARPTVTVRVPNEKASVVLLVDVSGSMRASDVKPTRLAAAKRAMLSFLDQAPDSLRIGVVSFSDEPAVIVAPTTDRKVLAKGIDLLRPGLRHRDRRRDRARRRPRPHRDPYTGRGERDRLPGRRGTRRGARSRRSCSSPMAPRHAGS